MAGDGLSVGSKPILEVLSEDGTSAEGARWPTEKYYEDLQLEMRRVTWPSWQQVRATTGVVIFAVFAVRGLLCRGGLYGGRRNQKDHRLLHEIRRLQIDTNDGHARRNTTREGKLPTERNG